MKKIPVIALSVLLSSGMFACGSKKTAVKEASDAPKEEVVQEEPTAVEEPKEQLSTDKVIDMVSSAVSPSELGKDEVLTSVTLENGDLIVTVDLSGTDTSVISAEDVAWTRVGSITDAILALNIDDSWNRIVCDFGSAGSWTCDKSMIRTTQYGRYMEYN